MTKKVLFINQEITPYVPESEMSVMGSMMLTKCKKPDSRFVLSCQNGEQ